MRDEGSGVKKLAATFAVLGGLVFALGGLLAGALGVPHGIVVIVRGDGDAHGPPLVHETWTNAAPWAGMPIAGSRFEVTREASAAGGRFAGTTDRARWALFAQELETVDVSGGPLDHALTLRSRTRAPYDGCAEAVGEGTARARLRRGARRRCVLFDDAADVVEITLDP